MGSATFSAVYFGGVTVPARKEDRPAMGEIFVKVPSVKETFLETMATSTPGLRVVGMKVGRGAVYRVRKDPRSAA